VPNLCSAGARRLSERSRPASSTVPDHVECLESRRLMAVGLDANGFTAITPSSNTRVVHVSSSLGDDALDGLSPERPVRSIARGASLVRSGAPDWMLLNRGDVWHETLGDWTKSGRSHDEPLLIGAYGAGARPRLETGTRTALSIDSASSTVRHVAVVGLHLVASARMPGMADFSAVLGSGGTGIRILSRVDDLLVEDCVVQCYEDNVVLQDYRGPQSNVTVRRSAILDAYSTDGGHSQGLYAYGVDGLLLEGNVFDHNGWSETVPGAPATIFNHNVYLASNNRNVVVRENVIANASSHGLQARSGGRVENNLFLDNPVGMTFGVVKGATLTAGGVSGVINGNVFLGGRDIDGLQRGKGLELGNTRPNIPTIVSNNIFSQASIKAGESGDYAILLGFAGDGVPNGHESPGVNDVTIQGNIVYRWGKGLRLDGGLVPGGSGQFALNRVTVRGNDFQQMGDGTGSSARLLSHDSPFEAAQEKWTANRYDAADGSAIVLAQRGVPWERWKAHHEPDGQALRAGYLEPGRSMDTYATATTGVAARAAFIGEARDQSAQNWRPVFTAGAAIDYFRAGFAEAGAPPRDWRAPASPIAVAGVPPNPTAGDATLTFTVTYGDDKAVNPASFDGNDVRLVGRKGRVDLPASVVSVQGGGEGQPVVVTYAVAAADGAWDRRDRGKYAIIANERQVADSEGFFVAAGELAAFKLKVLPRPKVRVDRPPVVTKAALGRGEPRSLTVWFSEDVSGTIGVDDLVLGTEDGATAVDASLFSMQYDSGRRAATWVFASLPAGRYRATVLASGVMDAAGQALDGDRDGAAGGDFVVRQALVV